MKYVFLFFLGTMVFFSCRYLGGKRVHGNGNIITSDRSATGFEGVESYGSFDITLIPASIASIKIEADENLQQYIETYVDNNNLQIRSRDGYNLRPSGDMKIIVSGPVFTTLSTHGSGSITGQGLLSTNNAEVHMEVAGSGNIDVEVNASKVNGKIAGSGNIIVKGSSKEFEGGIYGSGNIKAGNLHTEDSRINIAGSGNVEIFANNKLDVSVMGSGEIKHRGNAQVNTKISGSGSVVKID
ncbi:MAG TPA: head GIN domain-containing protein [Flavitalea sp.]|nr:head GIN domain-containing protein [Flavitalea sp.]